MSLSPMLVPSYTLVILIRGLGKAMRSELGRGKLRKRWREEKNDQLRTLRREISIDIIVLSLEEKNIWRGHRICFSTSEVIGLN